MDKIFLNGKRYIALGDFDHLRSNYVKDILQDYEKDENGQIHLSDVDRGRIDACHALMYGIMESEIRSAETPDDIRAMHTELRDEWMRDIYVIVGKDDEGDHMFFRMMCSHVPGDPDCEACDGEDCKKDRETPVFTNIPRLARTYSDHYRATSMCRFLKNETSLELEVKPAWLVMKSPMEILDAIFKADDEPEYHGDGTRAEDEDWDGEESQDD